jgi:hypothetical protein
MIPKRLPITNDKTTLPGHTRTKDRLTLLLGSNASEDFKLKPILLYHSDNPRVLKPQQVIRGELGVSWKSNHKAQVTRQLFYECASDIFCPFVESCLTKNKMEQ